MSDTKTVLVIDCAMEGCGVAVFDRARDVLREGYSDDPRGQAQRLVPLVQSVLADAGVAFDDLSDIVVCNGPGTFTGIRIGLSAAKAFGLVLGIPVYAITSLQAMALSAAVLNVGREVLVLIETRRQDFYVQRFDASGKPLNLHRSMMAEEIDVENCILIGNAVERFDPQTVCDSEDVKRINVGIIAKDFTRENKMFKGGDISPIYLRAPDVSMPKNAPRVLSRI